MQGDADVVVGESLIRNGASSYCKAALRTLPPYEKDQRRSQIKGGSIFVDRQAVVASLEIHQKDPDYRSNRLY